VSRKRKAPVANDEAARRASPWVVPAALVLTLAAVALAFSGVARHEFLNWDDPGVLVRNPSLGAPEVVAWAFGTTHSGHYQPLAWLAWAAVRRGFGAGAAVHHLASLVLHVANAGLVFLLAARLAGVARLGAAAQAPGAVAAALAFGLHPLRVEPVAWASAFPYVLALLPLLLSLVAYLRFATRGGLCWFAAALGLYGVSALCRPMAPGLALVLLILDAWLGRAADWRRVALEKAPFAAIGATAALAEAGARHFAPMERVGLVSRIGDAAWAPFVYVGRTLWPSGLTPLDPMPIEPGGSALAAFAGVALLSALTIAAWSLRHRSAALPACWLAFLVLAAPAAGLAPSGLQATADRYTYLPGVVLALLVGGAFARGWEVPARRQLLAGIGLIASLALAIGTLRYLPHWRDSRALWTRALVVDARNDVALYNLALALEESGDEDAAVRRYHELLRLIPDHAPARHNRDRLEAKRLEGDANGLAQSGRLAEAIDVYSRALALDPERLHSRRSRGMALAQLGRFDEAIPDLQAAVAAQPEPALVEALAYCLRRGR